MRWLAAWVVVSVVAFLVVAAGDGGGGTLAAPGLGARSSGVVFLLGVQLVVAVAGSIVVVGRRARRHGL